MENNNNIYMRMVKGLGTSFIFTLLGILIFSIILTYSNVSESITPIVLIAISAISILIGATISTRKINKNGMLHGGLIGGLYVIVLYLISSILNTGFQVNIYTILMILFGIVAGLIGGILGINS